MVETVTSAVLEQLKKKALDEYQTSRAWDASHKIEWYYGSVHNISNVERGSQMRTLDSD